MSDYAVNRIYKPPHFSLSPLKSGRPKRKPYVIGFDSEAESGRPFMFQFAHPDGKCDILEIPLRKHAGIGEFFKYARMACPRADLEYVFVGWNLQYEWTQLFRDLPVHMYSDDEFIVSLHIEGKDDYGVLVRALNAKRYCLTAEFGKIVNKQFVPSTKRRIRLIDGFAFLPMALDKAGELLGLGRKEPKPKEFSRRNAFSPEFRAYAEQDARLTQKLGEYIIGIHEQFDISTSVSSPHFASKVFRRKFLTSEIQQPDETLEQVGLWSYHGGKNGFYMAKPALVKKVWHYDIRSAYPEAMAQLPDVEQGEWLFSESYVAGSHSIWKIKAKYTSCKFSAFLTTAGTWFKSDGIIETVVTGYELDAALALNEVELIECEGYTFEGPPGGALAEYVATFYAMKRDAPNNAVKTLAKLLLNSLYGKFFQKVAKGAVGAIDIDTGEYITTDPSQDYDFEAGGLYHPPIASLITGYVRAKIHTLEHRYDALMTSTDGFFATKPPIGNELGDDLGMLSAEIGTLRIWRARLYVFDPADGSKPTYARHGFDGTLEQLRHMPLRENLEYHYLAIEMITLRMAGKKVGGIERQAGEFVESDHVLRLGVPVPAPP